MATKGSRRSRQLELYARELRLSLRINAGAYGFSVMITSTMAMLSAVHSSPQPWEIMSFLFGAVASFAMIETVLTRGFSLRPKDREKPEVVALGSSISLMSIGIAVGFAWLVATALPEAVAWVFGSFAASMTYFTIFGLEMTVARRIEEARRVD